MPSLAVNSASVMGIFSAKPEESGGKSLTARIREWVASKNIFGTYVNDDTEMPIRFSKGSADHVSFHNAGPQKAALMEIAPDLIKNGIFLEKKTGKKRGSIEYFFAAKATIDGEPYAISFVARGNENEGLYYDHSLTKIKALEQFDQAPYKSAREGVPQVGRQEESATDSPAMVPGGASDDERSLSNILKKHLRVNS